MPTKVVFTDRYLRALKPAPTGKRVTVWDAVQPHLGVRVTDKGQRSFVVVKRLAGDTRPTRHFLGTYPALSLAEARAAAPQILSSLMKGENPKELERRRIREERQRSGETFGVVAQAFIARHLVKLKSRRSTELVIMHHLLGFKLNRKRIDGKWVDSWSPMKDPRWRDFPITKISRRDVIELLEKISDSGSRYQARKVFAVLSKLFNWALLRDVYGLEASPIARIRQTDILGQFSPRSRVLSDDELRLIWTAAGKLGYPFGTLVQLLMLTGQRLREISNASWGELSQQQDLLVVPASRMKGKTAHSVPLTIKANELLEEIPRVIPIAPSDPVFMFSTTHGRRPFSGFAKSKACLDGMIQHIAQEQGEANIKNMPRWTLHDLRRTTRTRLSALGVLPLVAELVIGHKQTGIQAVYDLHTYDREKRAALDLWQNKLLEIVGSSAPPSKKIIAFRSRAKSTIFETEAI